MDLQELFESLGYDKMDHLSKLADKKSVNPKNRDEVLDYISIAYCGEKKVKEAEISNEEMDTLINSFLPAYKFTWVY